MTLQKLHNRLINFLRRRCPEIAITSKIVDDNIYIIIESTLVDINAKEKLIEVEGKASQMAYAMGRKIGSVHFSHWSRKDQKTIIRFTENFKFFPEKTEIFLLFIALFNDMEIQNYFSDKDCLLVVNEDDINVKVYVTSNVCVLVAIDSLEEITPITVEIGDENMIEKFNDSKDGKDLAKKKAKNLIEEEKKKAQSSKDGRQAVYGDTVEGDIKE
jgi:hypothetical protein